MTIYLLQDYLDCVEEPMDLSTMEKKLNCGQYSEPRDFVADMKLICNNSFCYNSTNTRVRFLQAIVWVVDLP